jgi:hypothetical protein
MDRWIRQPLVRHVMLVLFLLPLAGPALAAAQATPSLVELARQEEARKKAIKGVSKVYTDKDLKRAGPPSEAGAPSPFSALPPPVPAPVAQAEKPQAGKTAAEKAAAEKAAAEKDETWWKIRMNQARDDLRRNEVLADALQSRINALTGDFVNRDDPYQRAKIGDDRQKAIVELDRVKAEIERSKKQIADIEEEARQAGIPPGWIR